MGLDITPFERAVLKVKDSLKNLGSARGERGVSGAVGALAGIGSGVESLGSAAERLSSAMKLGLGAGTAVAFGAAMVEGLHKAHTEAVRFEQKLREIGETAKHAGEIAPQGFGGLAKNIASAKVEALTTRTRGSIGDAIETFKYGWDFIKSIATTGSIQGAEQTAGKRMLEEAQQKIAPLDKDAATAIRNQTEIEQGTLEILQAKKDNRAADVQFIQQAVRHAAEQRGIETEIAQLRSLGLKDAVAAAEAYRDKLTEVQRMEFDLMRGEEAERKRIIRAQRGDDAAKQKEKLGDLGVEYQKQMILSDRKTPFRGIRAGLFQTESDIAKYEKGSFDPIQMATNRNKLAGDIGSLQDARESLINKPVIADSLQRIGGGGGFYAGQNTDPTIKSIEQMIARLMTILEPKTATTNAYTAALN